MKKQLIIIGISVLLICVGLSGCMDNTDNYDYDTDTFEYNDPELTISKESYKSKCKLYEIDDFNYTNYPFLIGRNVTFRGTIEKIEELYDGKVLFTVSDENFISDSGGWYIYINQIYVKHKLDTYFAIGDTIQIWGEVQEKYTHYWDEGDITYYDTNHCIWAFVIERAYPVSSLKPGYRLYLEYCDYMGWKKPTYSQLFDFINDDATNEIEYNSSSFNCENFSATLLNNAREKGYRSGFVTIYQTEEETQSIFDYDLFGLDSPHAIVCFETSDKGLYFVEPQADILFSENEFKQMQNDGSYPYIYEGFLNEQEPMDFNHYSIDWSYNITYEWDYLEGTWVIIK